MTTFPDVRQAKTYDCSAACAKAVDESFGTVKPLAYYVNSLSAEATAGCDPRTLARFFRKQGRTVLEGEMTTDDLRYFTSQGRPVICPVLGHYVVVYEVSRGRIRFQDPWSGPQRQRIQDFAANWRDHDSVETFSAWGVCVRD